MILLDTHVLLWMDRDDPALGSGARAAIAEAWRTDVVAVCAISFWEVAWLHRLGRIVLPVPAEVWRADVLNAGVREIPLDGRIAVASTELGNLHRDPADRFIIATALCNDARLVTADAAILGWSGAVERVDARS